MWVLGRIMAGVRRWMSAQPPPSLLKSSKLPKSASPVRKPDLAIEPEREIDPTNTEGVIRRLLEPSVDGWGSGEGVREVRLCYSSDLDDS
jgi:hypothetical protein